MKPDLATIPLNGEGMMLLSDISDNELVALASSALSVPRTEQNSFTLHAPLELLARAALLPLVDEEDRPLARLRIASVAKSFLNAGDPVRPVAPGDFSGIEQAIVALHAAIDQADSDGAESVAAWLAERFGAEEIAEAAMGTLLFELGAAAHESILFASYLRDPLVDPTPFRGTARRLAQVSYARVKSEWLDLPNRPAGDSLYLADVLRRLQKTEEFGWGVFALVDGTHQSGVMAQLPRIAEVESADAFRAMFRVAAHSMLVDDPKQAPYVWSHALTMPLGLYETLPIHDRSQDALDMAMMLAAGFRMGHGKAQLGDEMPIFDTPARSASDLVSAAATHHDGHLVKYVQACLLVAQIDTDYEELYWQAAGYLVDWWAANPALDDPILEYPSMLKPDRGH